MNIDNPKKIEKTDIVVGIPSYNEAETIGFVVEQIDLGLKKYFPDKKSVIINIDNNSSDGTKEAFFGVKTDTSKIYISTKQGIKGKGYNFYNLFLMLQKLKAKAGIVFDADLKSIRPDWIRKMAEPVLNGSDFIVPYYVRYKTDATITNHLVHPLIYGLFGWNVRQPIGGDFAFSNKMVALWLEKKWTKTTYQFGIDVFMSLTAFFENMKTCQVNLGAKVHNLSNPKLGPMFFQVAGTLFKMISDNLGQIQSKVEIKKILTIGGTKLSVLADVQPDKEQFKKIFWNNLDSSWEIIENTVSNEVYKKLAEIRKKKQGEIGLDLWTKIVYDFLWEYSKSKNRDSLIETLGCLYFGRVARFYGDNGHLTTKKAEQAVVKRVKYFYKQRDYFLKKI